jgi:hypothetical protein
MENLKLINIEDVKNDDELLNKIINHYNLYCKRQYKYKINNKEKINQYMKDYYYRVNNKEPKKEKKTLDKKAYQKEYREKMKQKRIEDNNILNQ